MEAVFTRCPEREEVAEILSDDTREFLVRAGYPAAEVTISDSRLEIANTSLEELCDVLASALADRLAQISAGVRARHDAAEMRFQDAAVTEGARATAVAALAESVRFRTSSRTATDTASREASDDSLGSDRAQIDNWIDEGGHART